MTKQQKEIETIKPRKYMLMLSDADVERLAEKAGQYNLTASELLENFIGDLVDGTYTNGSDERDYADQWLKRCWFYDVYKKSLTTFLCRVLWYGANELTTILENIKYLEADIKIIQEEIEHPEKNWKELQYDESVGERTYKPIYHSLEEYIASLESDLDDYKEDLAYEEEKLEELKKEFADYMGNIPYTWEEQLEAFLKWREESVPEVKS